MISSQEIQLLRNMVAEQARRKTEALKLYRPLPYQEAFHASQAPERIIRGGNRCLAGETEIYDPVADCCRRLDEIDSDFHVWSCTPDGEFVIAEARIPWCKGVDDLYKITLSNGESFIATLGHQVWSDLEWVSVGEICEACSRRRAFSLFPLWSNSELCPSVRGQYVHYWTRIPEDYQDDCLTDFHCGDGQLLPAVADGPMSFRQSIDAHICNLGHWREDGLVQVPTHTPFGKLDDRLSISDALDQRHHHADSFCSHSVLESDTSQPQIVQASSRFAGKFGLLADIAASSHRWASQTACDRTFVTSVKFAKRDRYYTFEVPGVHNYLLASVIHRNSGKTLAAMVEVARAVTGCDPHGKYPLRDGRAVIVGFNSLHCSKVIYRKLFKSGPRTPFDIIKDPKTGELRPFNPTSDHRWAARQQSAGPLIPRRCYGRKGISWKNFRDEIPATIRLSTGWEVMICSSLSEPIKGVDIDLCVFDEEVETSMWYEEMAARLIDRRFTCPVSGKITSGKFIWAATPETGTEILYNLIEQAEVEKGLTHPRITDHHCTIFDNEYITKAQRDEFIAKLSGNEELIAVKVYGHPARRGRRVFPEFLPHGVHGHETFPIPDDWTRYIAVDPGRQVCAVLFAAVPPPKHAMAGKVILYDELYLKNCNAQMFAESLWQRAHQQRIRAGIIDQHAGRMTEIGSGFTVVQQYSNALKAVGFKFEMGGVGFLWGFDDIKAGIELIRSGLNIVDGQSAKWLVFADRVPNLISEMKNYVYKKNPKTDHPTDEPLQVSNHVIDCFRYLSGHALKWHSPVGKDKQKGGPWYQRLKRQCEARKREEGGWGDAIKVG